MSAALRSMTAGRTQAGTPVRVSIVIKALNECEHIAASIESALAAAASVGGEVILADSGSSDGTIEIARRYPITIVQLQDRRQRRCGVGPQLGYQQARGEFVYILDGDMELDPGFLPAALAAMATEPRLAGVAGQVREESGASYQFRGRKRRGVERIARQCEWLDMGGLYRATALREVGYFSNRNLHAFEEMELGLRLADAGWTLRRIPAAGVRHHGRPEGNWALLARRWRSGYLDGTGELLRAALGRRYFLRAALTQRHLFLALSIWAGLAAGIVLLPSPWMLGGTLVLIVALVLARALRTASIADAMFGQLVWQVTSLAMVRGFLRRQRCPATSIESVIIASSPTADPVATRDQPRPL